MRVRSRVLKFDGRGSILSLVYGPLLVCRVCRMAVDLIEYDGWYYCLKDVPREEPNGVGLVALAVDDRSRTQDQAD